MIKLNVINEMDKVNYKPLYKKILKATSKLLNVKEKRLLSVFITNNETIKEYNKKYRNIDKETDVLSFPSDEEGELGDIIISLDRAKEQAIDYGHSLEREMGFLMLHGCLHCLGYDHMTDDDQKEMFDLQDVILEKVNLRRTK